MAQTLTIGMQVDEEHYMKFLKCLDIAVRMAITPWTDTTSENMQKYCCNTGQTLTLKMRMEYQRASSCKKKLNAMI